MAKFAKKSFMVGLMLILISFVTVIAQDVIVQEGDIDASEGTGYFDELYVDTNVLAVDSTNDRVGIGITSPSYNLHVAENSTASEATAMFGEIGLDDVVSIHTSWPSLAFNAYHDSSVPGWRTSDTSHYSALITQQPTSPGVLSFFANDPPSSGDNITLREMLKLDPYNDRIYLDPINNTMALDVANGKVSINSDTFYNALHIESSTILSGRILGLYNPSSGNNVPASIYFEKNNDASNLFSYAWIGAYDEDDTAGSEDGALIFQTASNGSRSQKMRISSAGNLYLTNTNSYMSLYFNGSGANQGLFIWDSTNDKFLIDDEALINSTKKLYFNDSYSYIYDDGTDLQISTNGDVKLGSADLTTTGDISGSALTVDELVLPTSAPGTAVAGSIYLDTVNGIKVYDGSNWKTISFN